MNRKNNLPGIIFLGSLVMIFVVRSAFAHEYYLMPENFTPKNGETFAVRHRLGQKFKGNELPYIDVWNIRSEAWQNGKMRTLRGKDGDRPALTITARGNGLMSIVHQSNVDFLTFKTWEKFTAYATKEGLERALVPSEEGRKPKLGLIEAYARYAKTLVSIDGATDGHDAAVGLTIELVTLAHPQSLERSRPMPVQVLYESKPLAGAKVKIFVGIGTEFAYQIYSDSDGTIMVPADGPGPYLLNVIHMTEPQGEIAKSKGAHWESFWASLTFERAH